MRQEAVLALHCHLPHLASARLVSPPRLASKAWTKAKPTTRRSSYMHDTQNASYSLTDLFPTHRCLIR
jgi:hypothetical protein